MSIYLIQEETLAAIADKIREKSPQIWGQINEIYPQYFPVGIEDACTESASGGGSSDIVKKLIDRTITEFSSSEIIIIGSYAFFDSYIVNLDCPNVTEIGTSAFYACSKLALTSLPSKLTSIGASAFYDCSKLALTSLPNGLKSLGIHTFQNCVNLAITRLPSSLKSISGQAFNGCTGLTSITFEGGIASLPPNVFLNCTNLTTINVPWSEGAVANAPWGATNATINYNYTGG